jgi:hypothetical protein
MRLPAERLSADHVFHRLLDDLRQALRTMGAQTTTRRQLDDEQFVRARRA